MSETITPAEPFCLVEFDKKTGEAKLVKPKNYEITFENESGEVKTVNVKAYDPEFAVRVAQSKLPSNFIKGDKIKVSVASEGKPVARGEITITWRQPTYKTYEINQSGIKILTWEKGRIKNIKFVDWSAVASDKSLQKELERAFPKNTAQIILDYAKQKEREFLGIKPTKVIIHQAQPSKQKEYYLVAETKDPIFKIFGIDEIKVKLPAPYCPPQPVKQPEQPKGVRVTQEVKMPKTLQEYWLSNLKLDLQDLPDKKWWLSGQITNYEYLYEKYIGTPTLKEMGERSAQAMAGATAGFIASLGLAGLGASVGAAAASVLPASKAALAASYAMGFVTSYQAGALLHKYVISKTSPEFQLGFFGGSIAAIPFEIGVTGNIWKALGPRYATIGKLVYLKKEGEGVYRIVEKDIVMKIPKKLVKHYERVQNLMDTAFETVDVKKARYVVEVQRLGGFARKVTEYYMTEPDWTKKVVRVTYDLALDKIAEASPEYKIIRDFEIVKASPTFRPKISNLEQLRYFVKESAEKGYTPSLGTRLFRLYRGIKEQLDMPDMRAQLGFPEFPKLSRPSVSISTISRAPRAPIEPISPLPRSVPSRIAPTPSYLTELEEITVTLPKIKSPSIPLISIPSLSLPNRKKEVPKPSESSFSTLREVRKHRYREYYHMNVYYSIKSKTWNFENFFERGGLKNKISQIPKLRIFEFTRPELKIRTFEKIKQVPDIFTPSKLRPDLSVKLKQEQETRTVYRLKEETKYQFNMFYYPSIKLKPSVKLPLIASRSNREDKIFSFRQPKIKWRIVIFKVWNYPYYTSGGVIKL